MTFKFVETKDSPTNWMQNTLTTFVDAVNPDRIFSASGRVVSSNPVGCECVCVFFCVCNIAVHFIMVGFSVSQPEDISSDIVMQQ